MGDAIEYCKKCTTNTMCHMERRCMLKAAKPRWRAHAIRNTMGWVGIVDTHHKHAGHIAGWIRPEDLDLTLAALNHFEPTKKNANHTRSTKRTNTLEKGGGGKSNRRKGS